MVREHGACTRICKGIEEDRLLHGLEGLVGLESLDEALDRASCRNERHHQAGPAQDLEPRPSERVLPHLLPGDVHLHWEVHRERPEGGGPDQAEEVVEEGEYHRQQRRYNHVDRPPRQPEQVDAVSCPVAWHLHWDLPVYEAVLGPPLRAPLLYETEDRLAEHLQEGETELSLFSFS